MIYHKNLTWNFRTEIKLPKGHVKNSISVALHVKKFHQKLPTRKLGCMTNVIIYCSPFLIVVGHFLGIRLLLQNCFEFSYYISYDFKFQLFPCDLSHFVGGTYTLLMLLFLFYILWLQCFSFSPISVLFDLLCVHAELVFYSFGVGLSIPCALIQYPIHQ